MLCNSVRAVFVGVLFTHPVGWLEVFLQATETCPNSEKFTCRQGMKNAENSKCSSYNGFGPTLTTMTKLFAGLPATLTILSAGFSATLCRTFSLFSGQPRSHVVRCPQIVVLFVVLFVDCEEWLCILLGSLPVAFSFRLSKVGSLIEWLLRSSFCFYRENPIIRNLNSFSSCSGVDVLLHGDSVVQHYLVFFPPYG